jgi:hypothetical protein
MIDHAIMRAVELEPGIRTPTRDGLCRGAYDSLSLCPRCRTVVQVKNRLDKRFYAVKKIRLDGREGALSNRLRREVGIYNI